MKEFILKHYNVSKDGFVVSKKTGKKISFSLNHKGYFKARIYLPEISKHKDKRKPFYLHRIIACCFLDDYSDSLQVNHKNCIKTDNNINNLEMVNQSQNTKHAWVNNRMKIGERNSLGRFIKTN